MSEHVVDGQLHGLTAERLCAALEWRLYQIRKVIVERKLARQIKSIEPILSDPRPSSYYDSEELFEKLQAAYSPRLPYGYDVYKTWERAAKRAAVILAIPELREPGKRVLEVAAGDGMTGKLLADYGHDVTLCDVEDWRNQRAKSLPFISCDVCDEMPLDDASFDLIYSYNAMEHFTDPLSAFHSIERLARHQATVILDFGPLYCSPWGLHAYRALRMPYPQYLFSHGFIEQKVRELGIYDLGREMIELQHLNKWKLREFQELWRSSCFKILSETVTHDSAHLDLVQHFPQAFRGRDLTPIDLVAQGICVFLRKIGLLE